MANAYSSKRKSIDIPANFKSTLPPRKRAKTHEEREQRRVERVLRNRKAAHQSREKKRIHLKFLEDKCALLERILAQINLKDTFKDQPENWQLVQQLAGLGSEKDLLKKAIDEGASASVASASTPDVTLSTPDKRRSVSFVIPPTEVKDEEDAALSFNFSFGNTKDNTAVATHDIFHQIPSPSTSISTMGSRIAKNNNNNNNGSTPSIDITQQLQVDNDNVSAMLFGQLTDADGSSDADMDVYPTSIVDDDNDNNIKLSVEMDMETFASHLQQHTASEGDSAAVPSVTYDDYISSAASASPADVAAAAAITTATAQSPAANNIGFELEAAGTNTNNLLLMDSNELSDMGRTGIVAASNSSFLSYDEQVDGEADAACAAANAEIAAPSTSVIEAAANELLTFNGSSTNGSAASNDNDNDMHVLSDSFDLDNWRDPAAINDSP